MSVSADVNAGDDILASQYNNLREDVLDETTGHGHTGSGDGKLITLASLAQEVLDRLMNFRTEPKVTGNVNTTLTTVLNLTSTKGVLLGLGIDIASNTTFRARITVDGVIIFDSTTPTSSSNDQGAKLSAEGKMTIIDNASGVTNGIQPSGAVNIWFTDSLQIELQSGAGANHPYEILYAENV